jgi:TolB protein
MSPDGAEQRLLASGGEYYGEPAWSPDGRFVAYTASKGAGNLEINVEAADGSGEADLTNAPNEDSGPAWWALISP